MEANRSAILREIEEHLRAESTQDLPALIEGMTDDCYNIVVCDPEPLYFGPEAVTRRYRALWAAFPDLAVKLRRLVAVDGDSVVTEHTLSGTHLGTFFGAAPTRRPVRVDTAVVWEFRDGRIRGETVYFDLATVLRQVGLLPPPTESESPPPPGRPVAGSGETFEDGLT